MRPGAKGFLKVAIGLVVSIMAFVVWTVVTEFDTLAQDDPISHFMADMGGMGMALFGLGVGVLGSSVLWVGIVFIVHFRWPAKSRWKIQDEAIETHGHPYSRSLDDRAYRKALWEIHTGEPFEVDDASLA